MYYIKWGAGCHLFIVCGFPWIPLHTCNIIFETTFLIGLCLINDLPFTYRLFPPSSRGDLINTVSIGNTYHILTLILGQVKVQSMYTIVTWPNKSFDRPNKSFDRPNKTLQYQLRCGRGSEDAGWECSGQYLLDPELPTYIIIVNVSLFHLVSIVNFLIQ